MAKSVGIWGEEVASQWLCSHGYHIVSRNWRVQTGEIDIIATKDDVLVFAEVKTLLHAPFSELDIIVGVKKQSRIMETAQYFLQAHHSYRDMVIRFDLLIITTHAHQKPLEVMHFKNAFGAM